MEDNVIILNEKGEQIFRGTPHAASLLLFRLSAPEKKEWIIERANALKVPTVTKH